MTKSKLTPSVPTLTTPRLTLRTPKPEDAYERHRLGRDPEIILMFGYEAPDLGEYPIDMAKNWIENLSQHPCAWVIEHDGVFIGELRFDAIDNHDRCARLAIGIYAANKLGQGFGREAIKAALQHAFTVMNLHRISLRVIDYNERAIRCYRSVGFVEEGRERETAFIKGKWRDDLIMGLLDREFRPEGTILS